MLAGLSPVSVSEARLNDVVDQTATLRAHLNMSSVVLPTYLLFVVSRLMQSVNIVVHEWKIKST